MKKLVSLVLALALCLGLAAPALAVEYSVTTENDWGTTLTVTVDAVSVETTTIYIHPMGLSEDADEPAEAREVTLVTVAPGTIVSILDENGASADDWGTYSVWGYGFREAGGKYIWNDEPEIVHGGILEPDEVWEDITDIISIKSDVFIAYATEDTTTSTTTTTPTTGTTETTTPTTTPVEGGVVYTVKQYDTMGKIALNYYGSYGYHLALYKANSDAFAKTGGNFNTGMTLTLPDTLAGKTRLAEPTLAEGESFYTVKAGDTLGAIAAATYGDIMMYEEIYERNADRLKNANTIFEGQVIVLPAK